jgi:hypothetical protein
MAALVWLQVGQVTYSAASVSPNGLSQPDNVACRPHGGQPDRLRVEWKDTNENSADYNVYRKAVNGNSWGDPIATLTEPDSNDRWRWVDENAGDNLYHYRVTATDGNDETTPGANQTCREPLFLDSAEGNYRIFYRLEECPDYDGKSACTEDINVDGKNKHAQQVLETSEAYRAELMNNMGFNDPSFFNGEKPFPLDFFPCNNGCANGDGIQYPPANYEGADYDPDTGSGKDYEIFVAGHEIFHKTQGSHGGGGADPYYKWLIEGQARSTEDKMCIFDTQAQCDIWDEEVAQYYLGQVNAYLGKPEMSLLEHSYNAALFWTYVVEQFADTITTEPRYGMDVLLDYWQQNEENITNDDAKDGIDTLNDTLANKIGTTRRFKDIFKDFAVANYAKDLITNPNSANLKKYNYIDEENCPTCSYNKVKLSESDTLEEGETLFGTRSVDAWGARYFEIDLDPALPAVHIEVEPLAATPHSLYYHLLAIKNGAIVEQWSEEGKNFELNVFNINPVYDRLVLIVVGLEQNVNFNYAFNLTDGLFILTPNKQFPEQAGEAASPKKVMLQLEVIGADQTPLAGIDTSHFTVTVGSNVVNPPINPGDNPIVASSYIAGKYWLVLRAPDNPGCTVCDLKIEYGPYSDTEEDAIIYGAQPSIDNMIIIDRSGSMEGAKIEAAQGASVLYVDSYDTGDRIGVISYNDQPNNEFNLTGWNDTTREQAKDAIENLAAPAGATAIGAALREGMNQLIGQDSPNPAWAMVLLSDGKDTVEESDDHIPQFVSEYKSRKDSGAQVPVLHVVAIGDDADGVALEQVTNVSNGLFQWLPESDNQLARRAGGNTTHFPLDLSEIYRVFAETLTGEQQIYATQDVIDNAESKTHTFTVDGGASQLIISLPFVYTDFGIPININILRPDNSEVGPPTLGDSHHFVWRIPAPQAGEWQVVVSPIIPGTAPRLPNTMGESQTDFLVEASLISDLTMEVFLGLSVEERLAGKPMPLLVSLSDTGEVTGATVNATIPRTGESLTLFDDGQHGDGAANDGFYGGLIKQTHQAGGYSVIIDASGTSQLLGAFDRRARISFFMNTAADEDNDGLPDWWEGECMDPTQADRAEDPDQDGLNNAGEFANQTDPCDPDTDDGGEGDGSEVERQNDPLIPTDDLNRPPKLKAWAGSGQVNLYLSTSAGEASRNLTIYRATSLTAAFVMVTSDVSDSTWIDTDVSNGTQYCYQATATGAATSGPSNVSCATPNLDPHPPHGVVSLPIQISQPTAPTIMLELDAEDNPETEEHPPFDGELFDPQAEPSGVTEMQISNRADFEDVEWEPYTSSKEWGLAPNADNHATVFVRYRDAAGNVSDTVSLTVQVHSTGGNMNIYLPILQK